MLAGLLGLNTSGVSTPTSASTTTGFMTPLEGSVPDTPATTTSTASIHGIKSRSDTMNTIDTTHSSNENRRAHGHLNGWESPLTSPPAIKTPYKPEQALEDIPGLAYALQLFLESRMMESEEYCRKSDQSQ